MLKNITLDQLPVPQSRVEVYLSYLAGNKNISVDDLPIPQSRVEVLLYYLCINGGLGGGVQLPINANIVQYDKTVTNLLGSDNVQDAIDEMAGNMQLLKDSNIYITADRTEFDTVSSGMINRGELRTGDLFYILNSTGVLIHDGTDVDNNGLPVVLMYDTGLPNTSINKFRVFSRYTEKINLDFVEDIEFTKNDNSGVQKTPNKLTKRKNGATSDVIESVVTEWCDLETVVKHTYKNVFNPKFIVKDKTFDNAGNVINHAQANRWGVVYFNVTGGNPYTYIRTRGGQIKITFFNSDNNVIAGQYINVACNSTNAPIHEGKHKYLFTAPANAVRCAVEVDLTRLDVVNNEMILDGDLRQTNVGQVPFNNGKLIEIGYEIGHKFNNENTDLVSTTHELAIKEINAKINGLPPFMTQVDADQIKALFVMQ